MIVFTSLLIYCAAVWGGVFLLSNWAVKQLTPPSVEARERNQ